MDERLNIDEALALQLYGLSVAGIREMDFHKFDVMMFFYDGLQEFVDVAIDILKMPNQKRIASHHALCPSVWEKCFAATFANRTDSNAGNHMLLDSRLAMPVN